MIELLIEPFTYNYMTKAIFVSALVGGVCAFLSCYLILKGWALMGDALAHSVVPGVALAYLLKFPYALGAFTSGLIAALSITAVQRVSLLREDAVIGVIFTTMFAIGLLIVSINPVAVDIQTIIFGNILAISNDDVIQVLIISVLALGVLVLRWKDFMLIFFDESQARAIGLNPMRMQILFFVLLSACTVAALQTVGAVLVIAMVVTPGATAYLLTDRFSRMIVLAVIIGTMTSGTGAYISYFLDGATGGVVVVLQTLVFLTAFFFAPKHGRIASYRASRRPHAGAL